MKQVNLAGYANVPASSETVTLCESFLELRRMTLNLHRCADAGWLKSWSSVNLTLERGSLRSQNFNKGFIYY